MNPSDGRQLVLPASKYRISTLKPSPPSTRNKHSRRLAFALRENVLVLPLLKYRNTMTGGTMKVTTKGQVTIPLHVRKEL